MPSRSVLRNEKRHAIACPTRLGFACRRGTEHNIELNEDYSAGAVHSNRWLPRIRCAHEEEVKATARGNLRLLDDRLE